MSQAKLQTLHVQSQFLLKKIWGFRVWKLHEDIPVRMTAPKVELPQPQATAHKKKCEEDDDVEEQKEEDVQLVMEDQEPQGGFKVLAQPVHFLPACYQPRWSSMEMAFVSTDEQLANRPAYNMYIKDCHTNLLPAHTFEAFAKKRARMFADLSKKK